jgi:hypothetical protein
MKKLLVPAALIAALVLAPVASAAVTGISVLRVRDMGLFDGRPYREAALQIRGTAPAGPYRVPAVVTYPSRASDSNGAALVEPYNTVPFWFPDPRVPADPFTPARIVLSDDYVFGSGTKARWSRAAKDP